MRAAGPIDRSAGGLPARIPGAVAVLAHTGGRRQVHIGTVLDASLPLIAVESLHHEIGSLRDAGISVLLTDHNVRETLSVTDRSYIIFDGRVLRDGTPRELVNDPLVRKTYLGSRFSTADFED